MRIIRKCSNVIFKIQNAQRSRSSKSNRGLEFKLIVPVQRKINFYAQNSRMTLGQLSLHRVSALRPSPIFRIWNNKSFTSFLQPVSWYNLSWKSEGSLTTGVPCSTTDVPLARKVSTSVNFPLPECYIKCCLVSRKGCSCWLASV